MIMLYIVSRVDLSTEILDYGVFADQLPDR